MNISVYRFDPDFDFDLDSGSWGGAELQVIGVTLPRFDVELQVSGVELRVSRVVAQVSVVDLLLIDVHLQVNGEVAQVNGVESRYFDKVTLVSDENRLADRRIAGVCEKYLALCEPMAGFLWVALRFLLK